MERPTRQSGSFSRDSLLANAHLGGHLGSVAREHLLLIKHGRGGVLDSVRTAVLLYSLEHKGDLKDFSDSYGSNERSSSRLVVKPRRRVSI